MQIKPLALLFREATMIVIGSPLVASDEYAIPAGLYLLEPLRSVYGPAGLVEAPAWDGERPDHLRAVVPATLVESFRLTTRLAATREEQTTTPMLETSVAITLNMADATVGAMFGAAQLVEHQGCTECGADPGETCREANCQGTWV